MAIIIKTKDEIAVMREGGKILARILKKVSKMVKPGIATSELNRAAEALILKSGGRCSFLGYQGYPACLCTSINEEIVHAIPSDRILKEGDIISLDLGILYKGFHTDMAVTVPVGRVGSEVKKLIKVTQKALKISIEKSKPGGKFSDISRAVQNYIESQGFGVVKDLCGHGIGRKLHEDPEILNYIENNFEDSIIEEGMVFCPEPMVSVGSGKIKQSKDGFGYKTIDDSWACHFEHTIAVTKKGVQVLTK